MMHVDMARNDMTPFIVMARKPSTLLQLVLHSAQNSARNCFQPSLTSDRVSSLAARYAASISRCLQRERGGKRRMTVCVSLCHHTASKQPPCNCHRGESPTSGSWTTECTARNKLGPGRSTAERVALFPRESCDIGKLLFDSAHPRF